MRLSSSETRPDTDPDSRRLQRPSMYVTESSWEASPRAAKPGFRPHSRGVRGWLQALDAAIGGLGGCPFAQDHAGWKLAHGDVDCRVEGMRRGRFPGWVLSTA